MNVSIWRQRLYLSTARPAVAVLENQATQPGEKRRRITQCRQVAKCLKEGILCGILYPMPVAEDGVGVAHRAVLKPPDDPIISRPVTRLSAAHETH